MSVNFSLLTCHVSDSHSKCSCSSEWKRALLCLYGLFCTDAELFVRQSACLFVGPYNVLYSNALVFAWGHAWPVGKKAHFVAGTCICPNRRSAVVLPLFCKRRTVHFSLSSLPLVFPRIGCELRRDLGPQCLRYITDIWCLISSVLLRCVEVAGIFFSVEIYVVLYTKRMRLFYFVSLYHILTSRLAWALTPVTN